MKKLFLISILILLSYASAYKVEVTGEGVRIWKDWTNRITSKPTCVLPSGGEYEVVKVYAPWYKVEVLTGHRKGEVKYIWSERELKGVITKQGVTLRTAPRKGNDTSDGVLFKGDKVKILEKIVNRYLIKSNKEFSPCDFNVAWVWSDRCEVLPKKK